MNDTVSLACYNNTINLIRSVHRKDVTNVYEEYAKIAYLIESSLGGLADPLVEAIKNLYASVPYKESEGENQAQIETENAKCGGIGIAIGNFRGIKKLELSNE